VAGPMLNHLNFGGYLMWARSAPVFIDGRLEVVGERFFEEYRAALASQDGLEACVSRYGIRWLVFPYATSPDLLGRMSRDPRWILAYRDHLAAAFVRAGAGSAPPIERELARDLRPGGGPPAIPTGELPGMGQAPRTGRVALWVRGLGHRESFPSDEFNRGLFHIFRGELGLAEAYFASALRKSGGAYYEIYGNLGAVLFRQRRYTEARRCYEVVLSERPHDRTALERVAAIDRARTAPAAAAEPAPAAGSDRAPDAGPGRALERH